jgi:histidine triad (HIT) family protein
MDDCIFCKIVKGDIPCVKIYENDQVLVFADINPISKGHTLLIPKRHAENIWELSEDDLKAIAVASKHVADAVRTALKPAGVAVLQLNGRAVNQVVMHYHMHLIPRFEGDPELKMTAWELVPGDMAVVKKVGAQIAEALNRH